MSIDLHVNELITNYKKIYQQVTIYEFEFQKMKAFNKIIKQIKHLLEDEWTDNVVNENIMNTKRSKKQRRN